VPSTAKLETAARRNPARRRGGKRAHILEAAIRVFARRGYHGARIADIAQEAGTAYGLVYHYFENKEEILHTIFEERWGAFQTAVDVIAASENDTREKLHAVACLVLGAVLVRPDWVKVLVLEIQRSSRFAEPSQIRAVSQLFGTVSRILREGQRGGELRCDLDVEVASHMLMGALELAVTSLVLGVKQVEGTESQEDYCRRVGDTVVDVFFRGVRADPAAAERGEERG
jgi:TetR/AcrR family fatty acid metabolism transcriptional regulator